MKATCTTEAVERMRRIFAAVPELDVNSENVAAAFKLVAGFAPPDRWVAGLVGEVRAIG